LLCLSLACTAASAGQFNVPEVVNIDGHAAALINLDHMMDAPGDGCEQVFDTITVEGVQFSASGRTLTQFRYTNSRGGQMGMPIDVSALSNVEQSHASDLIHVGKHYFMHFQQCGSGGFPSLISIYLR
jgi:hypothetical protein